MRRALVFIVPFTAVLLLGLTALGASQGWMQEEVRGEATYIAFDALGDAPDVVRVSGMAHYTSVVTQQVPGGLLREPQTWYLFGLFAPYDTEGRNIRLLVRTQRPPEHLVSFELMTIEGRLQRPTLHNVPFDTEILLGKGSSGYFFADDMLLVEPWHIESGLDPRARPAED